MDYAAVERAVLGAREIVERHESLHVSLKAANDFVTDVDVEISAYMKRALHELSPQTGFFSEEEAGALSEDCWILDPIDGTTNLVFGYRASSVSLAHYKDGQVRFGIVYNPFSGESFTAELGGGAYLNHEKLLGASRRELSQALVEFGAGATHKENTDENFGLVKEVFRNCVDVRRICSSALVLCYIAAGRIDGYFEKVLKPWDYAAGSLILAEAGGVLTDYAGERPGFAGSTSVVAGNAVAQPELLGIVQGFYAARP